MTGILAYLAAIQGTRDMLDELTTIITNAKAKEDEMIVAKTALIAALVLIKTKAQEALDALQ